VIPVEGVNLSQTPGTIKWILEKSGLFSTVSLYRELMFPGVLNEWMMCTWRAKLPLKIKIFLWQVCNDKIQSAEQLKAKKNGMSANCVERLKAQVTSSWSVQ
jgi:hypothetical protein